jgi:hypothetical protein
MDLLENFVHLALGFFLFHVGFRALGSLGLKSAA